MIADKLALIESILREIPQIKKIHQSYVDPFELGHAYPAILLIPTDIDVEERVSGGQELTFIMHFSLYIFIMNKDKSLMQELENTENLVIQKLQDAVMTNCELQLMSLEFIDYGSPFEPFGLNPTIIPPFAIERQDWIIEDIKWVPSGEWY